MTTTRSIAKWTLWAMVWATPGLVSAQDQAEQAEPEHAEAEPPEPAEAEQGQVEEAEQAREQEAVETAETAPPVQHVPLGTVVADEPAVFRFVVRHPERGGEVVVRWRPIGGGDGRVRETVAARHGGGYAATVSADELVFPGLEYWVVRRVDGREEPVFASESDPHPVTVREPDLVRYERGQLAQRGGRRSRALLTGEYVGLGTRATEEVDGARVDYDEHYYQLEASYSYSFFTAVDSIRLSLGRMRGNVVDIDAPRESDTRGIDYGRAAITWRAFDLLHFRTGVLFGFSQDGFELGGAVDVVVGQPEGTSVTFGLEGVTTLGASGRVRLGWLTIPRLPMGATIEITNYPSGDQAGVRLLYDVGYELYPGAYARVEAGYRGWSATTGGPSLGGELGLAF